MTNHMRLRGPDADGIWSGEGIVLGHRRLAILDLDQRANQPMFSSSGRFVIVFNGEIYNFRDLRRDLEQQGVAIRTTSDTEILLILFEQLGENMLPRLRGMFAFAIWDSLKRELFIARDPYGIKPLYYTSTKDGFLFASQVKALAASKVVSTEKEPAALAGFFLWGSVPEPWTIYRDIFSLPAGHWMRVQRGLPEQIVCWHDIRDHWREPSKQVSNDELEDLVRTTVNDSVRAHLVSDVPVSIFLSGGIDSAALAGLVAQNGGNVEGITIGFEEFKGLPEDEVPMAAAVAKHYGLPHHSRRVSRAEFEADMPRILAAMDQPSIDGVNTWFASKAAAERGFKVVLSGVGGDELFCGYPSFSQIPRAASFGRALALIPGLRSLVRSPSRYFGRVRSQPKYGGIATYMNSLEGVYYLRRGLFLPHELSSLIDRDLAREGLARLSGSPPGMTKAAAHDDIAAVGLFESTLYLRNQLLRDSDWASMGHSLELRTPLVDAKLLEQLGPVTSAFASGKGKRMLARSPRKELPTFVVKRVKTGFAIPMARWLSEAMEKRLWSDVPMLAVPGTPWARRWARTVIMS